MNATELNAKCFDIMGATFTEDEIRQMLHEWWEDKFEEIAPGFTAELVQRLADTVRQGAK